MKIISRNLFEKNIDGIVHSKPVSHSCTACNNTLHIVIRFRNDFSLKLDI